MHLTSTRRRLSMAATATALVGASLAFAPAAKAAPVFVDAETVLDSFAYAQTNNSQGTTGCSVVENAAATPDVPVVENGPTATTSTSVSATFSDTDNGAGDTATASGSASASGRVTSSGGVLNTMDFSATSSYSLISAAATSECDRYGGAGVDLEFQFTITQPGFLQLEMKNSGGAYGEVYLFQVLPSGNNQPYYDNYGQGLKFSSDARVFLPAGTYDGYFEGASYVNNDMGQSATRSGTTTVHADFAVAGSQIAAPVGKAKKYVKFPASRNCAADTVTPTITEKGKRAEKIQSVKFFVNGTKVKKVSEPSKGQGVSLTVADDQDADVRALVKLEKVKKGVPAKKLEVISSYIACS